MEYADDHDISQIVIGSHGRSGMPRILQGTSPKSSSDGSPTDELRQIALRVPDV